MKRALFALALAASGCATLEQQSITAAEALSRRGSPLTADVQGMQIVVRRVRGAPVVSSYLCVKGGVRNWGKEDAGVEALAFATAASGGTAKLGRVAFARVLDANGGSLGWHSGDDYSGLLSQSLPRRWDFNFALLVEAFLHPALPDDELERQRQLRLSSLRHELEVPDGELRLLMRKAIFHGHPYENRAAGSIDAVSALTREKVAAHLAGLRATSRLLLVVVGDVEPAHVIERARAAFAGLPRGSFEAKPLSRPIFTRPELVTSERKLPTNYIEGTFLGPGWGDPDFAAGHVAMHALAHRVWEEVRSKRSLSYAPAAWLTSGEIPLGGIYASTVDPNTTMKVMLDEARRLQAEPMPEKELSGVKATYLTQYLMGEETTLAQAVEMVQAQVLGGDARLARTMRDRIGEVTPAEVQAFARKYIGKLQMVVLGDPDKIDPKLFESL